MADAIGILGFALHATHKVYTILESIRDAPDEIQALRDEALQVHSFLKTIQDSQDVGGQSGPLHMGDAQDARVIALVERAQRIEISFDKFIGKATTVKANGLYEVKKLKWPRYVGEAKKLSEQVKAFHLSLTAAYTVSTSTTVAAVRSDLARHEKLLQTILATATLQNAASEQRQGRSMLFDELCTAMREQPSSVSFPQAHPHAQSQAADSESTRTDAAGAMRHDAVNKINSGEVGVPHNSQHTSEWEIRSPGSKSADTNGSTPRQDSHCPDLCSCACHSDICPIPSSLNPWLGRLNIPRALAASLLPSLFPCSDALCARSVRQKETIRYYTPIWSAVEGSIRFKAFPVHFCIQTPRVVPSLNYLEHISFNEYRMKLSNRELTIFDVEPDGTSILHYLLPREMIVGDAFDLITLVLDAGIPKDWLFENMTPTEWVGYCSQLLSYFRISSLSLDLSVIMPFLHTSLDEALQTLDEKRQSTDLHSFLIRPHSDVRQALDILHGMLALPGMGVQINCPDGLGWIPLDYATHCFPEAVELLLQVGASPRACQALLLNEWSNEHWTSVSALIRAGYYMRERDSSNLGNSLLHSIPKHQYPYYRHAVEIVRHGGHLIGWSARDDSSDTSLEIANHYAKKYSGNGGLPLVRGLRRRLLPPHAQWISSFDGERLMTAEEAATRPRISLTETCVSGDTASIGPLISAGAMVNERDKEGRTLLHLVAMGDRVPNGYRVVLELERHGRYGIDHGATFEGKTALEIAEETLQRGDLDVEIRNDMVKILAYLEDPRLPDGEQYVFPCMDPNFCNRCHSLRCTCVGWDEPDIPGTFRS